MRLLTEKRLFEFGLSERRLAEISREIGDAVGDNTARLLEHVGFSIEYRIRALLVKDLGTPDAFSGETRKVQRKSFFRRLQEQKGSPRIDWEEVIVVRKGE